MAQRNPTGSVDHPDEIPLDGVTATFVPKPNSGASHLPYARQSFDQVSPRSATTISIARSPDCAVGTQSGSTGRSTEFDDSRTLGAT